MQLRHFVDAQGQIRFEHDVKSNGDTLLKATDLLICDIWKKAKMQLHGAFASTYQWITDRRAKTVHI